MEWDDLPGLFPMLAAPERWLDLLQRHAALIQAAAARTRVTSVAPEEAVQRHYAESLETWRIVLECVPRPPRLVVDVGSGGGFPGLVMACVAPDTRFELVEPLQKRARMLSEWSEALGLANVGVHPLRAEEAGRGPLRHSADLVVARAVASLSELLEYTAPFAAEGARVCLPKGSAWAEELAGSEPARRELGTSFLERVPMRPEISALVSVLVFEQARLVPKPYPRRPGVPGKRPL
jgi:16S rRNA (guanine527-N7)-methyltransferase